MGITRVQAGIILVIIGTVFLAFSVKTKRQYVGEYGKAIEKLKKENTGLIEPTEAYIVRKYFWIGLFCIALGSLLQW